jgi:hypothetical protein
LEGALAPPGPPPPQPANAAPAIHTDAKRTSCIRALRSAKASSK